MAAIRAEAPARTALAAALVANAAVAVLAFRAPGLAVAVVAVGVVVTLAFARPGLVLLVCAFGVVASADLLDVLWSLPQLSVAGVEILPADIFLVTMLLAWGAWELRREGDAPSLAVLVREPAFPAWIVFASLGVYDLGRGGQGTLSSARILVYCVVVPPLVRVVRTGRQVRLLAWAIVGGGMVAAFSAVITVASGHNVTDRGLSTGGLRGLSIGASFLVAAALLCVLAAVVGGARRPELLTGGVVLLLAGGVAASGARETWVGVLGALAIYAVASSLRGSLRLALVTALAGLLAFGAYEIVPHPPQLAQTLAAMEHRLLSTSPQKAVNDPSVQVRYDKWRVVWDQMKAHPVLGTGFGYPATYTSNIGGNNFVRSYVDDPENTHLWLWARMGTLGFLAWVVFNLTVLASLLRLARAASARARSAALWAAGILLVVWAGMTFSPVSAFAAALMLYWFAIALLPVARRLSGDTRDTMGT